MRDMPNSVVIEKEEGIRMLNAFEAMGVIRTTSYRDNELDTFLRVGKALRELKQKPYVSITTFDLFWFTHFLSNNIDKIDQVEYCVRKSREDVRARMNKITKKQLEALYSYCLGFKQ